MFKKIICGSHSESLSIAFLTGLINSLVHTVMHLYYALLAVGPSTIKHLWWKRHLTTLQLVSMLTPFLFHAPKHVHNDLLLSLGSLLCIFVHNSLWMIIKRLVCSSIWIITIVSFPNSDKKSPWIKRCHLYCCQYNNNKSS